MLFKLLLSACLALYVTALPQGKANFQKRARAALYTQCTVPNTVALTFDDGPFDYINDISKVLKDNNATGTFFFNGNNYHCIYDQDSVDHVKYVYDQGHHIASHTWSHPDLNTLTADQIHDEMWKIEQALMRITGAYVAFMRPPFGNYNDQVLDVSGVRGQDVVIWDFDSEDSVGASAQESKQKYDQIASKHPSTLLALNHETYSTTAYDVLPHAIQVLKAKGYNLVSVADCVGKPKYQYVGAPEQRTADWHC
ncbi:carbohydrate esterase family 4 protein [Crepidotus variabilis]|uniref:Carbohydrate esterase family 4 protein n=1 Tax=Crepidotus variabilis TaxID=179855 RepID=A0A9P6JTN4_9AGAR|nr:carbohydrate esterase family 4 protein [Crepidotus variabilis]